MCGHPDAGAGAGLEPAPEPEPLPAAGRVAPEHCCRGGRSSGYWVGASPRVCFFFNGVSFARILSQIALDQFLLSQSIFVVLTPADRWRAFGSLSA
jgi:hypothetical protein